MFTQDDFHSVMDDMEEFNYYQTSEHSPDDFRDCPVCNGLMEIYRDQKFICGNCDHEIKKERV